MDYAIILNQYRSLTVGFQQNIAGSNRYPKKNRYCTKLAACIINCVDMRIRINGQQSLCNLLWNSKVETHHRSRERNNISIQDSAMQITDVLLELLQWEWGCSINTPDCISLLIWQWGVGCQ